MPVIDLRLVGKNDPPPWTDIDSDEAIHLRDTTWEVAVLEAGMGSGEPSVALRIELPDGETLIAETSLAAWSAVTIAARARHPEAFAGGPLDPRDPT